MDAKCKSGTAKAGLGRNCLGGLPGNKCLETSVQMRAAWNQEFQAFLDDSWDIPWRLLQMIYPGSQIQQDVIQELLGQMSGQKPEETSDCQNFLRNTLSEKQEFIISISCNLFKKPSIKTSFVSNVGFRKFRGFSTNDSVSSLPAVSNNPDVLGKRQCRTASPDVPRRLVGFKCCQKCLGFKRLSHLLTCHKENFDFPDVPANAVSDGFAGRAEHHRERSERASDAGLPDLTA